MQDFRCIECGKPTENIYIEYGKGNLRLAVCKCGAFVDKYVEYDEVLIFIDMILLKPQAYRHMIFNGVKYNKNGFNGGIFRMLILLNLFEVCKV
jgi:hypothetical protein